ncbi:MAG: hypothetical protein ACRDBY_12920 [Cetobacterium sp.]
MNKFKLNRSKFKKLNYYRKNPSKYIPHNAFYCYGVCEGGEYTTCKFLINKGMNSYQDKIRDEDRYDLKSAKCSFTGHWIFDYCKHCDINEEFKKDKNGEDIW